MKGTGTSEAHGDLCGGIAKATTLREAMATSPKEDKAGGSRRWAGRNFILLFVCFISSD